MSFPAAGVATGLSEMAPIRSKAQGQTQRLDPTEKLSLFNATISYIVDADPEDLPQEVCESLVSPCACGRRRLGIWFPVRGKYDSGSDTDFISENVIKRAGLEPFVVEVDPVEVKMFGVSFSFSNKIRLSWQLNNEEVSYTREFWVAQDAEEFDLIIGDPWLMEHGYDVMQNNQSRKRTLFFGMLKIGRKGKGNTFYHREPPIGKILTFVQQRRYARKLELCSKRKKHSKT